VRGLRRATSNCLAGDDLLTPERLPPRDKPWTQLEHVHGAGCRCRRWRSTRKAFMDAMQKEGIGTGVSYEAIHLTTLFRNRIPRGHVPDLGAHRARETVTLPLFPEMREMDVERVCESMKRVMRRKAA